MTFSARALGGKHVPKSGEQSIEALGVCDITGFVFPHSMLKKQMDWRGNQLCWTGLMVGEPYLDEPNTYNRPPPVKADPYAVENPRLPPNYVSATSIPNPPYAEIYNSLENTRQNQPTPGGLPQPQFDGGGDPLPPK